MQLPGAPRYGWSPQPFGLVGAEIIVEQLFETDQYILVDPLAGDELAVVKADAVVQQQFDGRDYDGIAVTDVYKRQTAYVP